MELVEIQRQLQTFTGRFPRHALQAAIAHKEKIIPWLLLEDVLTPPGGGVKMSRALPHARLLMIPDYGHVVPDEKPEICTTSLLAFLTGIECSRTR